MPDLADYTVFTDKPVDLPAGGNQQFVEQLPSDIASNQRGFVSWNDRKEAGSQVNYVITLNGHDIRPARPDHYTVNERLYYTRQEVFSGSLLNAGGNNTIEFRALNGTGKASISDVVLRYKRHI